MRSFWSNLKYKEKGLRSQILALSIILVIVLVPTYENKFFAFAQSKDCLSSLTTRIDSTYSGPVFLDSYWTDQAASSTSSTSTLKKEVGPGDGVSSLATVLVNRSAQDIYAVTGYLKLPVGFKPAGISGSQEARALFDPVKGQGFTDAAEASFNSKIPAGETFTLYFDINATEQAKVGSYGSSLIVKYYNTNESQGCTSALLDVPFLLPGRVILDAVTTTQYLSPQTPNTVEISIENKGSSDATGVVATIASLGDSGSTSNRGSGSSVILSSSSTSLVNLGANTFNIGTIPAFGKTQIKTTVYPNISAGGTVQNVGLLLSYGNAYGYRQSSILSTGLVILPTTVETSLGISYDEENGSQIITAGKVEDLSFTVRNNGKSTLNNLVVSLSPQSDALKILGNSQWTLDSLEPNSKEKLSTTVFAAKTLIGSPTSFVVTADYISNAESRTDSLNLGAFVSGDIRLGVFDLTLNYIGNTPNISGNLLNQGSTTGMFATIEVLPTVTKSANGDKGTIEDRPDKFNSLQAQASGFDRGNNTASFASSQQYLGDLTADSSIPFSIPIKSNGNISPGIYPVTFKVVYADDLKNSQEIILDGKLSVEPKSQTLDLGGQGSFGNGSGNRSGMQLLPLFIIVAVAVAGGSAFFIIRKRRSSSRKPSELTKTESDDDIDALLDDFQSAQKN